MTEYKLPEYRVIHGKAEQELPSLKSNSVHSICCDPPSGIAVMGLEWDTDKGGRDKWVKWLTGIAREGWRILRPGGWGVVWALPKTSHWTATAFEDAGFEIVDIIHHHFGNGLPKVKGVKANDYTKRKIESRGRTLEGKGTNLKPASEHWLLVRKPYDGNVADCIKVYGTGALEIDACRIGEHKATGGRYPANLLLTHSIDCVAILGEDEDVTEHTEWECADNCPIRHIDNQSGIKKGAREDRQTATANVGGYSGGWKQNTMTTYKGDGGASRYFAKFTWEVELPEDGGNSFVYMSKPSRAERHAGLDVLDDGIDWVTWNPETDAGKREEVKLAIYKNEIEVKYEDGVEYFQLESVPELYRRFFGIIQEDGTVTPLRNAHRTVKPVGLMRYLVKLVTPPGGTTVDMFAGSGTTGKAAYLESLNSIMIEMNGHSIETIHARMNSAKEEYTAVEIPKITRRKINKPLEKENLALF